MRADLPQLQFHEAGQNCEANAAIHEKCEKIAVVFDPDSLPLTAAYVAGLPQGLDSYPKCRVRTAVTQLVIERFPHALEHAGVERAFVDRLRAAVSHGEWMPEALGTTVRILTRDAVFASDDEYNEWNFQIAGELFARPFYRVLMYVVSPTLVMLGAQRRWSAFREGTTLSAKPHANGGEVVLTFPARLYTPLVVAGFGQAFRASLVAARARGIKIELEDVQPDRARWSVVWD